MIRLAPSYILLLLASLVFAGGVWWLIMPQLQALVAVQAQKAIAINSVPVKAAPVVQAATKLADRKRVLQLDPSDDGQYDLAVEVEGLSHAVGVSLTGLTLSATAPATKAVAAAASDTAAAAPAAPVGPTMLTLTLGISGGYGAVQAFIQGLPTLSRFVTITQLTMSGSAGATISAKTPVNDTVTATLVASAPYQPKPTVINAK